MKCKKDCSLFFLRLVVGIVFIAHGWAKLQGMEGTIAFFASLDLGSSWAYLVAWVEFFGGVSLLIGGGLARLASYLLAIIMLVAIGKVKWEMGLIGGYEFDLTLFAALLTIAWASAECHSFRMCSCGNCDSCRKRGMHRESVEEASM
jgi:uncharacterized membrane protein YphA (DoxX/SURF4 family)